MADRYWKGANLGSWGTNSNWSSDLAGTVNSVMPTASDTAIFNASSVTGSRLIYLGAPTPSQRNVLNIIGNSSLVDVQLVGGTTSTTENVDIYVNSFNAVILQAGSGPLTIGNDGTNRKVKLVNNDLNASRQVTNASSSRLTFNSGLTFFNNLTIDVTGTGNVYVKVGDGASNSTLTVTGNTNGGYVRYDSGIDGFVQVNSGWLQLGYDPVDNNNLVDSLLLFGGKLSSSSTVARSTPRRVRLSGSVTLGDATNNGALTFSGTTTIAGNTTLNLEAGNFMTFSGAIAGTGSWTMSRGTSTSIVGVKLTGPSGGTSGAVTANANVVLFLADFNSGTPNQLANAASITANCYNFQIAGNTAYTFTQAISGTTTLYSWNAHANGLTFNNFSGWSGAVELSGDTNYAATQKITVASAFSFGTLRFSPTNAVALATQTFAYTGANANTSSTALSINSQGVSTGVVAIVENGSSNLLTISGQATHVASSAATASTLRFATTSGNITYSGNITEGSTGTLNLSKTGSNVLTLTGTTSTYKGTVSVSAGTLNANSATALGLDTSSGTVTSGATLSLGAALNYSTRNWTINGFGVFAGGNNGAIVLNTATAKIWSIQLGSNSYIRGTVNGSLISQINLNNQFLRLGAAPGTTFTVSGGISDTAGATNGCSIGFESQDTGTVLLNTANSFVSSEFVNLRGYGTLSLGHANALGSATLVWNFQAASPGTALDASTPLTISNSLSVLSDIIFSGSNALTLAGTVSLGASRIITTNGSGGALTLSGVVSGTGFKLTKAGTNILALDSANTYTGGTDVGAGTLKCNHVNALNTTGTVTLTSSSATLQTATSGQVNQNGKLTVAALNNAAGGIIKIGG